MKSKNGRLSPEQKWWIANLSNQGYYCRSAYSFDEAVATITQYLEMEINDIS